MISIISVNTQDDDHPLPLKLPRHTPPSPLPTKINSDCSLLLYQEKLYMTLYCSGFVGFILPEIILSCGLERREGLSAGDIKSKVFSGLGSAYILYCSIYLYAARSLSVVLVSLPF